LEEDDLPDAFFAALVELLPEGFRELFVVEVAEEPALRLFTEVLAAVFFLGVVLLVCEPWAEVGLLLDAALVPEPAAV
jgi:hypothetical protein